MAIDWNDSQKQAIEGRNGTMLVSAAAGSGKTAVLVERVIRKLCDKEHPINIENLLIVTFTRAAAAQMKEKIAKALNKKIAEEPDNKELKRNLFMMPYSNICTIDSFCINLVRENFHRLDISPDFQIADNSTLAIMEERAMAQVMDSFHKERSEDFRLLNDLVNSGKTDNRVREIIKELYNLSCAYVFPEEWLYNLCVKYGEIKPLMSNDFTIKIMTEVKDFIAKKLNDIENVIPELQNEIMLNAPEAKMAEKYLALFSEDITTLTRLSDALDSNDWAEINYTVSSLSFGANTSHKALPLKKKCSAIRTYSKKENGLPYFISQYPLLTISEQDYIDSVTETAPCINLLTDAAIEYGKKLRELKDEENAYGFNDILHFTLDMLVENVDGEAVRTEFAKELSKNFDEILVDEYQDVSKAQDTIFKALSKDDTNRFMVGDVKQSIYSFRQAMPEVFTDLRKSMTDYDGENYPARVVLNCNYRSRRGVTNIANFIFEQIMTEYAGGVDYNEAEYLNPQAKYPEKDINEADFEVYVIESDNDEKLDAQAEFAAKYIKEAIENKVQVGGEEGLRDIQYSDFCILMRGVKAKGKVFEDVFAREDIPLVTDTESPLLGTPEAGFVISLLKVIDNPLNDIPLATVLLSPVYGFTPDDLALMRSKTRDGHLYTCLVNSAKSGDKKSADFIDNLKKLRRIAVTKPAGEFTAEIIDESGFRAVASSMTNGEIRVSNLNLLINLAVNYEKTGVKGISGFVRFLTKLEGSEDTVAGSSCSASSNSVKMMTIHKSKGLEFPYVFVANCEKAHNNTDFDKNFIVSRKSGIGLKWTKNNLRFKTVSFLAARDEKKRDGHSEELRVLYVALTRAKEKTIVLTSYQDVNKKLTAIGEKVTKGIKPDPKRVIDMSSYSDYILTALMKHPDAHELRNVAGLETGEHEPCDTRAYIEIVRKSCPEEEEPDADTETEEVKEEPEETKADEALLNTLTEQLSYVYPYEQLNSIISKRIASDIEDEGFNEHYFASAKPAFTSKGSLTPAQRGTATHRFMQYADYKKASLDPDKEKERLVEEGMLTELEAKAVDSKAIRIFFESALAKRILAAEKVYKEYSFTASVPVCEVYPEIDSDAAKDDVIIIEGVADCAFEENGKLVIVDYKTDKANSEEELKEKYTPQLETYRRCLSQALAMEVSETIIYSFRLGTEIKLNS